MVSLILWEEWFNADKEVLIFGKISRLTLTAIKSCVKEFSWIADVRASKSCFFVHHIKWGTRIVVILPVAFRFYVLMGNTSAFKNFISLKNWFLTILQFKLEKVFEVVNCDDGVKNTRNFREKIFFCIIWRQLVTLESREFYTGVKL